MEYITYDHEKIKQYWNRYVAGFEEIPDHLDGLDDRILRSWKRSKSKANPFEENPVLLNHDELEKLTKEKLDLIKVAVPYMIQFYEIAKNATQNVLLTDEKGKQLKNVSSNNEDLLELMNNASVANGSNYGEDVCGTSSVSLSMYEDSPILLRGYEHYRAIYHDLACFSIPIHSLGNKQVGCICVTGPMEKYQPFVVSACIMMVRAIENELRYQQTSSIMEVVSQNLTQGFLVLNDKKQILQYNEKACQCLGISTDLTNCDFNDFFLNDFTELKDLAKQQENKNFQYVLVKPNHFQIALSLKIVPICENGQDDLYLFLFTSVEETNKETSLKLGYTAKYFFHDICGVSKETENVKELGQIAANSSSSVLIIGESGTGKEQLAQAIHNESSRKANPFITIRCGSVPKEWLEIELFGDDNCNQIGKIELADGGTLFLEDVEQLSMECQIRLLNFFNTKTINQNKELDVRIIACSQKDLLHLTNIHCFRTDLYYKLNVIQIQIPPLRQRRKDIQPLIRYYTNRYRKLLKKQVTNMEKRCLEVLMNYNWPGNARELESIIERLINTADGSSMRFADLPNELVSGYLLQKYSSEANMQDIVSPKVIEYGEIIKILKQEHGHVKTAAVRLNMPISTLYRKCTKYNIDPKKYREW